MPDKKTLVLDAGAVINDSSFSFSQKKNYLMPSSVFSELRDFRSKLLADNALKNSLLKIEDAPAVYLKKAKDSASRVNTILSKQDLDVLALAIFLKEHKKSFAVITDDYSLQNVLSYNKILFEISLHEGIKKHFVLKKKCSNCGSIIKKKYCEKCDSEN